MSEEQKILTDEMLRVRGALETRLLKIPHVDFVSIGFAQELENRLLVSLGTSRPDLVQLYLDTLLRDLAIVLHEHLLAGRWQPEIQILKGSTKQTLTASP